LTGAWCVAIAHHVPNVIEEVLASGGDLPPLLLLEDVVETTETVSQASIGVVGKGRLHNELPRFVALAFINEIFSRGRRFALRRRWQSETLVLRSALLRAYDKPPLHHLQALASTVGSGYKRLQRAWSMGLSPHGRPSRTEFLQAVLFLRILEQRLEKPECSWDRVAFAVGVTKPTLAARFRQFAGCTPGALEVNHIPGVVMRLQPIVLPRFSELARHKW
jgi:hypothetical protein